MVIMSCISSTIKTLSRRFALQHGIPRSSMYNEIPLLVIIGMAIWKIDIVIIIQTFVIVLIVSDTVCGRLIIKLLISIIVTIGHVNIMTSCEVHVLVVDGANKQKTDPKKKDQCQWKEMYVLKTGWQKQWKWNTEFYLPSTCHSRCRPSWFDWPVVTLQGSRLDLWRAKTK